MPGTRQWWVDIKEIEDMVLPTRNYSLPKEAGRNMKTKIWTDQNLLFKETERRRLDIILDSFMKEGKFKPRSWKMKTVKYERHTKGRGHWLGEVTLPKGAGERKAQWCIETDKNWQSRLQKEAIRWSGACPSPWFTTSTKLHLGWISRVV